MPITVADPPGALMDLMDISEGGIALPDTSTTCGYVELVRATLNGTTYWNDLVLSARHARRRPATMFRVPGFSLDDPETFDYVEFHEFEDPDDISW
jgi:hypothetical protein